MEILACQTCKKPKATLHCGICQCSLCKKCAQTLDGDEFLFLEKIPESLSHDNYCGQCFDNNVAKDLAKYEENLEKSKDVKIYSKEQSKETRLMKRSDKIFKVVGCPDREETIARLAFLAAQENFNTIIDLTLTYEKVIVAGYQCLKWNGTAIAHQLDLTRLRHRQ